MRTCSLMKFWRSLRQLLAVCAISAAYLTPAPGLAQKSANFPTKPITLVSPYGAGGINDFLCRLIGKEMEKQLGQPVIVVNRAGGGGVVGATSVANAAPDGYTIMLGALGPLAINKLIDPDIPYDPREFEPVIGIGGAPNVLVVTSSLPVKTVADLVKYIQSNQKVSFSSGGLGTPQHLSGELFNKILGVSMTHVPYRGSGQALVDVAAGHLQVAFDTLSTLKPHLDSGRVRPIAVLAPHRLGALPNVPTMQESGIKGLEVSGWYGFVAPAGTPAPIRERLRAAVSTALNSPELRTKYDQLAMTTASGAPEEFRALIKSEMERWTPIIRSLNIPKEK